MDDTNQLEEYLMRFDIFINNLKLTQILLRNFIDNKLSEIQLPANCQLLLKTIITEEYFQVF